MRSFKIGTLVVLAALAAPALNACGASSGGSQQEVAGTLSLKLSGTSSSGATYRLRNATFAVSGPKAVSLSSETNVDATSIKQELPAGNYLINLKAGWTLEKGSGGMFTTVKAVLTSQNPAGFNIADQGTTSVVYQFKAGDDVVQLGDGTLSVEIGVTDGCGTGQVSCGGACIDVTSDPFNCGACGNFCMSSGPMGIGQCVNGQCFQQCLPGQAQCGGACADLNNDPFNCGACGVFCPGDATTMVGQCVNGVCGQQCGAGQAQCGGGCADLNNDPFNCGACGVFCPGSGATMIGQCANGVCGQQCAAGQTMCGGVCANLGSDPQNCGMCGRACVMGTSCQAGLCL